MFKLAIVSTVATSAANAADLDAMHHGGPHGPPHGGPHGPPHGGPYDGPYDGPIGPHGPHGGPRGLPHGGPGPRGLPYGGPGPRGLPYGGPGRRGLPYGGPRGIPKGAVRVKGGPRGPSPGIGLKGLPPKGVRINEKIADVSDKEDLKELPRGKPEGADRDIGSIRGGRFGPDGGKFGPRGGLDKDSREELR